MTVQPWKRLESRVGISVLSTSLYNKVQEPVVEVTEFGTFQYVQRTQLAVVISLFVPLHSPLLEYLHCPVRGLFCTFCYVLFFVDWLICAILCWLILLFYRVSVVLYVCCVQYWKKSKEAFNKAKETRWMAFPGEYEVLPAQYSNYCRVATFENMASWATNTGWCKCKFTWSCD